MAPAGVHWPVAQSRCPLPTDVQPVRGQNVPESHACGMQNAALELHWLATHAAPPEQSPELSHEHWPELRSQIPEAQSVFALHCPARAQLPPCGG
jgi:hypothetical protein